VNLAIRALLVAVVLLAFRDYATAQVTMPPASTQGLFGSGPAADANTTLDLRVSLIEGYDSDVPRQLVSTIDPVGLQTGGFSTLFDAGASYAWRRNKTGIAANATSVLRHYADLGSTKSVGHSAGIGLNAETLGGTGLVVNQSAAFTPGYLFGLFPTVGELEPGDSGMTAPDYAVSDFESYTYTTTMALSHNIGSRSTVSATGEFQYTDRLKERERWTDLSSYLLRTQYSRNATRNTAVSTEIRYRSGVFGYGGDGHSNELALNIGVDFSRPISATRRTSFSVRLGLSAANYKAIPGLADFQRQRQAVGDVSFSYPFNQTWVATAGVRRGLEYVADLPTPVVSNGATASVIGLLTRRVDVVFSAAYATGESALNRNALFFDTYTADVRLRYAVSRMFALFGEYLYYYYDFQNGALLLAGMPPGLERNGVRAGLTLWMPALRR